MTDHAAPPLDGSQVSCASSQSDGHAGVGDITCLEGAVLPPHAHLTRIGNVTYIRAELDEREMGLAVGGYSKWVSGMTKEKWCGLSGVLQEMGVGSVSLSLEDVEAMTDWREGARMAFTDFLTVVEICKGECIASEHMDDTAGTAELEFFFQNGQDAIPAATINQTLEDMALPPYKRAGVGGVIPKERFFRIFASPEDSDTESDGSSAQSTSLPGSPRNATDSPRGPPAAAAAATTSPTPPGGGDATGAPPGAAAQQPRLSSVEVRPVTPAAAAAAAAPPPDALQVGPAGGGALGLTPRLSRAVLKVRSSYRRAHTPSSNLASVYEAMVAASEDGEAGGRAAEYPGVAKSSRKVKRQHVKGERKAHEVQTAADRCRELAKRFAAVDDATARLKAAPSSVQLVRRSTINTGVVFSSHESLLPGGGVTSPDSAAAAAAEPETLAALAAHQQRLRRTVGHLLAQNQLHAPAGVGGGAASGTPHQKDPQPRSGQGRPGEVLPTPGGTGHCMSLTSSDGSRIAVVTDVRKGGLFGGTWLVDVPDPASGGGGGGGGVSRKAQLAGLSGAAQAIRLGVQRPTLAATAAAALKQHSFAAAAAPPEERSGSDNSAAATAATPEPDLTTRNHHNRQGSVPAATPAEPPSEHPTTSQAPDEPGGGSSGCTDRSILGAMGFALLSVRAKGGAPRAALGGVAPGREAAPRGAPPQRLGTTKAVRLRRAPPAGSSDAPCEEAQCGGAGDSFTPTPTGPSLLGATKSTTHSSAGGGGGVGDGVVGGGRGGKLDLAEVLDCALEATRCGAPGLRPADVAKLVRRKLRCSGRRGCACCGGVGKIKIPSRRRADHPSNRLTGKPLPSERPPAAPSAKQERGSSSCVAGPCVTSAADGTCLPSVRNEPRGSGGGGGGVNPCGVFLDSVRSPRNLVRLKARVTQRMREPVEEAKRVELKSALLSRLFRKMDEPAAQVDPPDSDEEERPAAGRKGPAGVEHGGGVESHRLLAWRSGPCPSSDHTMKAVAAFNSAQSGAAAKEKVLSLPAVAARSGGRVILTPDPVLSGGLGRVSTAGASAKRPQWQVDRTPYLTF